MSDQVVVAPKKKNWPSVGAHFLGRAESAVLILIGVVLVGLAVLMLGNAIMAVIHSAQEGKIREEAIEILDSVLLVMMTMEIVYTVAISLEAHALVAEPFLIIGAIAAIRRMLVITATSSKDEHTAPGGVPQHPDRARAPRVHRRGLMALSIYILKKASAVRVLPEEHAPEH